MPAGRSAPTRSATACWDQRPSATDRHRSRTSRRSRRRHSAPGEATPPRGGRIPIRRCSTHRPRAARRWSRRYSSHPNARTTPLRASAVPADTPGRELPPDRPPAARNGPGTQARVRSRRPTRDRSSRCDRRTAPGSGASDRCHGRTPPIRRHGSARRSAMPARAASPGPFARNRDGRRREGQ